MDAYEISLFNAMVILLGTVLLLISLLLFFFICRQRRYRQRLKQQASKEVNRTETERSRLSMDLHDDLRSLLTTARLQLMLVREGGENVREDAAKACACVDQLGQRLQEIASNLSPRLVAVKGLKAGLENLVKTMEGGGAIRIDLHYQLKNEAVIETRVHLYRMVQELLQNAAKHSDAQQVYLRLEEGQQVLRLLYRDNGKGFVYTENSPGMGLSNLRNRVELLDGTMDCRSEPGQGTFYLFEIPKILRDG